MLKLMIVGRRRGGMTRAEQHRYMRDVHGAMVAGAIAETPRQMPQRYVQNHVFDATTRRPAAPGSGAAADPFTASRDFVTQVWFTDPAQAAAAQSAPFFTEKLQPDEDNFVDQGSIVRLPVAEQPLFATEAKARTATGGVAKLFVFHQAAPGVDADALAAATLAHWQPLLAHAPEHAIERVVRNAVRVRPGEAKPTVDVVDEVWLGSEDAARRLGAHWQALVDGPGLAEGPALAGVLAPHSGFVLLAHEHVLHAGA